MNTKSHSEVTLSLSKSDISGMIGKSVESVVDVKIGALYRQVSEMNQQSDKEYKEITKVLGQMSEKLDDLVALVEGDQRPGLMQDVAVIRAEVKDNTAFRKDTQTTLRNINWVVTFLGLGAVLNVLVIIFRII